MQGTHPNQRSGVLLGRWLPESGELIQSKAASSAARPHPLSAQQTFIFHAFVHELHAGGAKHESKARTFRRRGISGFGFRPPRAGLPEQEWSIAGPCRRCLPARATPSGYIAVVNTAEQRNPGRASGQQRQRIVRRTKSATLHRVPINAYRSTVRGSLELAAHSRHC